MRAAKKGQPWQTIVGALLPRLNKEPERYQEQAIILE